tara:strand:- start:2903 stop:3031 length:129 start_codon:yes stop_codon:yes gene_type:complete
MEPKPYEETEDGMNEAGQWYPWQEDWVTFEKAADPGFLEGEE